MRERKVKIAGWGNTLSGKKIEQVILEQSY